MKVLGSFPFGYNTTFLSFPPKVHIKFKTLGIVSIFRLCHKIPKTFCTCMTFFWMFLISIIDAFSVF